MPYETELFHATVKAIGDNDRTKKLVLGKWQEYTFQYESGFGILCLDSRLTIWRYNRMVCLIDCKQLTVNDEKKIKSHIGGGIWIEKLMDAIEQDQTITIGNIALLWRITVGGYIAKRQSNSLSKGC